MIASQCLSNRTRITLGQSPISLILVDLPCLNPHILSLVLFLAIMVVIYVNLSFSGDLEIYT